MAKICRLLSTSQDIPHQTLQIGDRLTVGRNRCCRIRDIKCSRSYCEVTFDGNKVSVVYCKSNKSEYLSNGQLLSGIGFKYKIVFIENNNNLNVNEVIDKSLDSFDDTIDSANDFKSIDKFGSDDKVVTTGVTQWMSLNANRVHICKFLGGGQCSKFVAAFDFDETLVSPKSGNKFAIDSSDWKLLDKSLPKKIEKLVEQGFRFVIFSNQLGLSQGRVKLEDIQQRFESALTAIGCPCLVMIGAFDDIYRKPRPGLWQLLANDLNNDMLIDMKTSFFVGDAAGRKKQLNGKSDHSAADLLFAANCGLNFLTPERFLSDVKPKGREANCDTSYAGFPVTTYRPKKQDMTFIASHMETGKQYKDMTDLLANYYNRLHIIVFCGLPASGKSSLYLNHLRKFSYYYVSRDELKTMEKCYKKCESHLRSNENCVIDNLNVDLASRKQWISLSKKYSAIPLLFYFDINVNQSLHNNKFRQIIGINSPVTDLVIRSQNKNFLMPSTSEGFESIYKINFVSKFSKPENESLFFMYLAER
ncbi:uncharacterized protein F21D5.5-like [Oppia nitens]|uniref:uncharacterized protein F21D5.5-like n=1 Tax=Oppia nitens TaxID=1686743 RepID=UPI0023DBF66D|nr:uncharacterized protein F21D5.5-like [Oppia nitens]